jgi:hypothetical protein
MEQTEFLEKNVFTNLKNHYKATEETEDVEYHFSEADFETVLEKAAYYGIGIYKIEAWDKSVSKEVVNHDDFKKKATDPKWYQKAFAALKLENPGHTYSASYKVSAKLLAR